MLGAKRDFTQCPLGTGIADVLGSHGVIAASYGEKYWRRCYSEKEAEAIPTIGERIDERLGDTRGRIRPQLIQAEGRLSIASGIRIS